MSGTSTRRPASFCSAAPHGASTGSTPTSSSRRSPVTQTRRCGANQAERLVWESDTVEVLDRVFLEPHFSRQAVATPEQTPPPPLAGSGVPSPAQLFGERAAPARSVQRVTHGMGTVARLGPDRDRVEEAGEHVAQRWILTRGEDNI